MPNFLFNSAVATPAIKPDKIENNNEIKMEYPLVKKVARIAAPKVKEPSTVRSGKFIILKEMTIPNTAIAYNNPCCKAPLKITEPIKILLLLSLINYLAKRRWWPLQIFY